MSTSRQPSINAGADDWLVFADQLQAQGDARGELIALNHAVASGSPPEARDTFVRANAEKLLGPAGKRIDALRLGWRWMWIDSAEVVAKSEPDVAIVAALLESPACAQLGALALVGDPTSESNTVDLSPALQAIASRGLPESCRSLSMIDARAARSTSVIATFYDPPANLVGLGELDVLWPKLAKLERLHLSVSDANQIAWGTIALPSLTSFRVDCLTWGGGSDISEAFEEASWPNLTEFSLRLPEHWTSSVPDDESGYTRPYADRDPDEYGDDDEGYHEPLDWDRRLVPLLESLKRTKLRKLALTSFASPQQVLGAIRDAGLPPTVVELDLSHSSFDDQSVGLLLENKTLLKQLKRLVLESVPASKEEVARVKELGIDVVYSEGMGATYRFLVGME